MTSKKSLVGATNTTYLKMKKQQQQQSQSLVINNKLSEFVAHFWIQVQVCSHV